jgi:hypothetical protein
MKRSDTEDIDGGIAGQPMPREGIRRHSITPYFMYRPNTTHRQGRHRFSTRHIAAARPAKQRDPEKQSSDYGQNANTEDLAATRCQQKGDNPAR